MSDGTAELNRLAADLGAAGAAAVPFARVAIQATLFDIKATARADAPVYSGRYARSITYNMVGPLVGEVGPRARYGHLVEDGGARSAPNPVMARATKAHEDDFEMRLARAAVAGLW
jgi:hypothetical protein